MFLLFKQRKMQDESFDVNTALFEYHCINKNVNKATSAIALQLATQTHVLSKTRSLPAVALSIVCRPNGKQVEQECMHQNKNQLLTKGIVQK